MNLKFALSTYSDLIHGSLDVKVRAFLTFAIWFAAGGYIFSSLGAYINLLDTTSASFLGAILIGALAPIIKFS